MAENNHKLNDMNKTALDSIRGMLDANTIIGDPINTVNGTVIIPVSKITVGYASGGVDYLKRDAPVDNGKPVYNNFGGGGGTGLTVQPVGFLIVNAEGQVNMLNINAPAAPSGGGGGGASDPVSSIVNLIEHSPDLIEKLKAVLAKKGDDNQI